MIKAVTKLSNMACLYTRAGRIVHTRTGDILVKAREGDAGVSGCDRGMSFGLDRQAAFPLYDGSPEEVRRALRGGVAQLVRAAES